MNADTVHRMARATLSGTLPFPDIVGRLLAEGVEYYRIDYVARQMWFYGSFNFFFFFFFTSRRRRVYRIDYVARQMWFYARGRHRRFAIGL